MPFTGLGAVTGRERRRYRILHSRKLTKLVRQNSHRRGFAPSIIRNFQLGRGR